jgi:hypothetical protein
MYYIYLSHVAQNFTGVDCAGTGLADLFSAWGRFASETNDDDICAMQDTETQPPDNCETLIPIPAMPVHLSGMECDKECQIEILSHPLRPRCLFGDVENFLWDALRKKIAATKASGAQVSLEDLLPAVKAL